jgi:hypothetical protein
MMSLETGTCCRWLGRHTQSRSGPRPWRSSPRSCLSRFEPPNPQLTIYQFQNALEIQSCVGWDTVPCRMAPVVVSLKSGFVRTNPALGGGIPTSLLALLHRRRGMESRSGPRPGKSSQRSCLSRFEPRNPKPEKRNTEHGTRNTEPENRKPKHGTRNPKHETRKMELGTRNSKPEQRNTEPENRKPKHGTRNTEPETRKTEHGTRNPKPEIRNPKHGTLNPKPHTLGRRRQRCSTSCDRRCQTPKP